MARVNKSGTLLLLDCLAAGMFHCYYLVGWFFRTPASWCGILPSSFDLLITLQEKQKVDARKEEA